MTMSARHVAALRFSPTGSLVAANQAAARRFGFTSPDRLVASFAARPLLHVRHGGPRWFVTDEPAVLKAECTRQDGGLWICRAATVPVRASSGEVLHVEVLLLDDEGMPDSMLNDLPNPIFVKDEQHRWVALNDSYCRFMGYRREELLGKSDRDFFPREEADVFWAQDDLVFGGAGINENEERFTDAAGRMHVILTRKALHTDPSGRRLLVGIITDISLRKQEEDQVKRTRDELDRRVAERTGDLREANRQLQEEHRRKDEFLALLGHELRNPLNPVVIAASLMRRSTTKDPTLRRPLEIIERQVAQMKRLIDDLLDVSRITKGKILLRPERFDLVELTRTVVNDRREGAEAHGLRVEVSLLPSPLSVVADPARIAQALGNLLDNAEKFSERGGRVEVAIQRDDDGRGVSVHVIDAGIGMSRETLARIFTPFVQAEQRAGRGRGGLGLGLSLVRGLLGLHGGTATAHSEGEGRGSRFTLWLPLPVPAETAPPEEPAPKHQAGPQRILVIEDNADAAEALVMALSAAGHEVAVASSGEEGVARAREFHPRIVLSDIGLPGMTGYDVARVLRQDRALASTRLVAVTGYGQEEDQQRALSAGFDEHLTKPFDVEALERLIARLTQSSAAPRWPQEMSNEQ